MIKVKVTKSAMNKSINAFGLKPIQIVFGVVGSAIGIITFFLLREYIQIDLLMWIIFAEIAVIMFLGCVRINDMSFFTYIIKIFKTDIRKFNRKGGFEVEDDE